jgi:hypothetical protein
VQAAEKLLVMTSLLSEVWIDAVCVIPPTSAEVVPETSANVLL